MVCPVYPLAISMFTPASMRPLRNGRTTAARNFFTGTPVHSALGLLGSHPVPSGLAPTYSNSPRASRTPCIADLTLAVTTVGSKWCGPPWTTRCPTTSISEGPEIARVSPLHKLWSKCSMTCAREPTDARSFRQAPREFFIEYSALSSAHSIFPSQMQLGGSCGSVSPIS